MININKILLIKWIYSLKFGEVWNTIEDGANRGWQWRMTKKNFKNRRKTELFEFISPEGKRHIQEIFPKEHLFRDTKDYTDAMVARDLINITKFFDNLGFK